MPFQPLICPRRTKTQTPPDKKLPPATCRSPSIVKKGFFTRPSDGRKFQRYKCMACGFRFSSRTLADDYRVRNTNLSDPLESLLVSSVSQRRCALAFGVSRSTVARRIPLLARIARSRQQEFLRVLGPRRRLQFDEMRTFEHTKMKPLSIPLLVCEETQAILGTAVARMPADGLLAERSRKKYGRRENEKPAVRRALLARIAPLAGEEGTVASDEETNYPEEINKAFPKRVHLRFKGRKACVVGQGELKAGGKDPLFALNHAAAMVRDNLKRLSRRTWCTTKKPEVLADLLDIYTWFHNDELLRARRKGRRPFAA